MERIAYLQCPTGIAGDMFLGALVSAGVPLEYIENGLKGLNLSSEYQLKEEKVLRQGQSAVKIHVDLIHHHHHHRHLADIENLIISANLSAIATTNSLAIFRQLAEAEGKVHGISPQKVHFHEVGAIDALVDIVGPYLGLDYLNNK